MWLEGHFLSKIKIYIYLSIINYSPPEMTTPLLSWEPKGDVISTVHPDLHV